MNFFRLFFLFFLITNAFAATKDVYPFNAEGDAERFQTLTQEIRCVVCQNQNIADSNAPLAADLRKKVYQMILVKKSNSEIKDYLVNRYGEFILFTPRFKPTTFFLWLFPIGALLIALIILSRFIGGLRKKH